MGVSLAGGGPVGGSCVSVGVMVVSGIGGVGVDVQVGGMKGVVAVTPGKKVGVKVAVRVGVKVPVAVIVAVGGEHCSAAKVRVAIKSPLLP